MTKPSEPLARAIDLYRRGDLEGARRAAEDGLGPDSPDSALLQFLGHVCCRLGDFVLGIANLRRALDLDPANAGTRVELCRALLAAGDAGDAEAVARETEGLPPGAATELMKMRAYIFQSRGEAVEAARCYEQIVSAEPGDFESWNNLGNARREAGDPAGAVEALRRAASLRADLAPILLNLAGALGEAGRPEEGRAEIEEAVQLAPRESAPRIELGRILARLGRPKQAADALEIAARDIPQDATIRVELGLARAALDDLGGAERAFRGATALDPAAPAAWNQLALLLDSLNRGEELGALIENARSAAADESELAFTRALHARREGRFEEALSLARAAPASTEPHRKAQLIGELLDRLGDSDGAFEAFGEMNRSLAALPSDPRAQARAFRQGLAEATDLLTPDFASRLSSASRPSGRASPVFLVGFPRSGTTLLDTMLMGHSRVEVVEEKPLLQPVADRLGRLERLAEIDEAEAEELRALYFETLDRLAAPAADRLVVDKMPLNMVQAPLLHRLFPDAHFIFAQRHPADVVLSCYITNFRLNPAMANFLDLEDSAAFYDLAMSSWSAARALLPIRVHEVRYERMVEGPEAELRPLFEVLGLEWQAEAVDHRRTALERGYVATASYAQVTEPLYKRASGRWRRYAARMAPVLPILAPWAERLGYEM
ncbi:MAG TPA: sulfotransferase [Allosphingosinicella sp.]